MQPHAHVPRLLLWFLVPLLLVPLPLIAPARAAHADMCGSCANPSAAQIKTETSSHVKTREGMFGPTRDSVHMDKGDCIATMEGAPEITPLLFWLEKRAEGEVWNCPHSQSTDTITVEASNTDSTSWTVTASAGFKLKAAVAEVTAAIATGNTTGVSIKEVTRVSKTIMPGWCRRVPWQGFFLLGTFKAEAEFKIEQEWAWWTKNSSTGSAVHAKGRFRVHCGSATLELQRRAPIAGHFRLTESGCNDPACGTVIPKKLGFFPPLPGGVSPPSDPDPDPQPEPDPEPDLGDPEPEPDVPAEPEESSDLEDPPAGSSPDPLAGDGP